MVPTEEPRLLFLSTLQMKAYKYPHISYCIGEVIRTQLLYSTMGPWFRKGQSCSAEHVTARQHCQAHKRNVGVRRCMRCANAHAVGRSCEGITRATLACDGAGRALVDVAVARLAVSMISADAPTMSQVRVWARHDAHGTVYAGYHPRVRWFSPPWTAS